jgi:hypothetical protein
VGEHDLELNALRIIWSTLRREIAPNLGSALALIAPSEPTRRSPGPSPATNSSVDPATYAPRFAEILGAPSSGRRRPAADDVVRRDGAWAARIRRRPGGG